MNSQKRAFTLIELLVVIAIIAILAAILFPVFAQAREKARSASCLSNHKQMSSAVLMYSQDYDELMPLAYGYYPGFGWLWEYVGNVPYNNACSGGNCGPNWTTAMTGFWVNSTQPYTKNFQIFACPSSAKPSALGANVVPAGAPANARTSYTYNGLLMAYAQAGVGVPAQLPLITESNGAAYFDGYCSSNPVLQCPDRRQGCSYLDVAGGGDPAKNGETSIWFGFDARANVHANGQNWSYCDGHVKYKGLSTKIKDPGRTNPYTEPWAYYAADERPDAAWVLNSHVFYFMPDNEQFQ
jgi:prepilin-type N-terminal cleavage/methylation domain-containing protein/prepilin-type processing-associated H-X9-DG protein